MIILSILKKKKKKKSFLKVVLTFVFMDKTMKCNHPKTAFEQYLPGMQSIMFHKVVLRFQFVDEILKCDHWIENLLGSPFESVDEILKCVLSSESIWAIFACGAVYYDVQDGFWVCNWNPQVRTFNESHQVVPNSVSTRLLTLFENLSSFNLPRPCISRSEIGESGDFLKFPLQKIGSSFYKTVSSVFELALLKMRRSSY